MWNMFRKFRKKRTYRPHKKERASIANKMRKKKL